MRAKAIRRIVAVVAVLGTTAAIGGQERDMRVRLTAAEVDAVRTEVAGAGTSGLPAVTTRVLFGDPTFFHDPVAGVRDHGPLDFVGDELELGLHRRSVGMVAAD